MSDATAERQALLVMDMQPAVLAHVADAEGLLSRVRDALAAARAGGIPVLYVVVRFRPGFPEISARNLAFSRVAERLGTSLDETGPDADVDPRVGREPSEPVVAKRRVGAFSGSDLDVLLRAADVDHLVLAGFSTSGVVLSTVRLAADLDYRLTVLADCCGDRDEEVHRILIERVFPSQAAVMGSAEWAASLPAPSA